MIITILYSFMVYLPTTKMRAFAVRCAAHAIIKRNTMEIDVHYRATTLVRINADIGISFGSKNFRSFNWSELRTKFGLEYSCPPQCDDKSRTEYDSWHCFRFRFLFLIFFLSADGVS